MARSSLYQSRIKQFIAHVLSKVWRKTPIEVHVWGGLGSQLFSYILLSRLASKNFGREVQVFFHQGGVTARNWQLTKNFVDINSEVKDFYAKKYRKNESLYSQKVREWKSVLVAFAQKLGILSFCNSEEEVEALKPWVLHIRGHYSYLDIQVEELKTIYQNLGLKLFEEHRKMGAIHYRMGDLLTLDMKNIIDPDRVLAITEELDNCKKWKIYSDSSSSGAIDKVAGKKKFCVGDASLDILEVIQDCVRSEFFVGTNSKISFWIALFRIAIFEKHETYLPYELVSHFASERWKSRIRFY